MKITQSKSKKLADDWVSLYIRLRATDYSGIGTCVTCGAKRHWQSADCGHFQSRGHMATRFHEKNIGFQCKRCNGPGSGEQYKYSQYIDNRYGKGTAAMLETLSRTMVKFNVNELLDIARKYRDLARTEAQKRGIDISKYEEKNRLPDVC